MGYNRNQIQAGRLTTAHLDHLVRVYQETAGLTVDGKCGPKTLASMPVSVAAGGHVARALSALGKNTRYKLGAGGYNPDAEHPGRDCDCSGFVAWVIGYSRKHKFGSSSWISTSDMVRDAKGKQALFGLIDDPVPGCVVVYGDAGGKQGHCGIITRIEEGKLYGVDCAGSSYRRKKDAIQERDFSFFVAKPGAIFCAVQGGNHGK